MVLGSLKSQNIVVLQELKLSAPCNNQSSEHDFIRCYKGISGNFSIIVDL